MPKNKDNNNHLYSEREEKLWKGNPIAVLMMVVFT
jgi:hypothetical protein